MRKLVLVSIALVLAALVWMFAKVLAPSITRSPAAIAPKSGAESMTALDPLVDGAAGSDPVSRSRLVTSVAPPTGSETASTLTCALRVVVRFAAGEHYEPNEFDVRVLDVLGEEHFGQSERDNAFLFSNLPPDTYTIDVAEAASMRAVQRVRLDTPGATKLVELMISPTRALKVHWTASDGRPISQAVLDPDLEPGEPLLQILASHVQMQQADFGRSLPVVASIKASIRKGSSFDDLDAFDARLNESDGTSEGSLDRAGDASDPSLYCTFEIRTRGTLWLSAWYRGALLGTQSISQDQTDVYFTTVLAQLRSLLVPVSLRLVDDVTRAPVTRAQVMATGESTQVCQPDSAGHCAFRVEPGWTNIDVQQSPQAFVDRSGSKVVYFDSSGAGDLAGEHASRTLHWVRVRVFARPGEPLELGDIRVPHARTLRFRVLDSSMRPARGAKVELIRESSYDDVTGEHDVQQASSDGQGLAVFSAAANETYVVVGHLIRLGSFDTEPTVVDVRKIGDDPDAIAEELVLRPMRKVSIAFDPPPRPGAKALIETTTGLPVSAQDLDELGLCMFQLGGIHYRLRLAEDGQVRLTVPFSIASDPYVLTVQR